MINLKEPPTNTYKLTFLKISQNMVDWGGEFRFLKGIHVPIDIKIDIFISITHMITSR